MRVGIGYDIHALKKGRKFFLGGVEIPFSKGLLGHSDGDVLIHALVDAVLGAAGLGDIGEFFSSADPRYRNAQSSLFVKKVLGLVKKKGLKISHVDSTVIAQAPKLGPFRDKIRKNLAKIFGIRESCVGVKAKTNEGFGAVGRGKAVACFAVASLER